MSKTIERIQGSLAEVPKNEEVQCVIVSEGTYLNICNELGQVDDLEHSAPTCWIGDVRVVIDRYELGYPQLSAESFIICSVQRTWLQRLFAWMRSLV